MVKRVGNKFYAKLSAFRFLMRVEAYMTMIEAMPMYSKLNIEDPVIDASVIYI